MEWPEPKQISVQLNGAIETTELKKIKKIIENKAQQWPKIWLNLYKECETHQHIRG